MFERIFPGELNKWKRKFVNLRVSLELTVEIFWLNWYIYFRTVSYMGTQINLRLTIEITIVYHVNGCRWLKRQCYKFAYWIRHWHIPNVTVTKKIDNAIITVCSYEFSSWVAWVRCDICHQYTFVTNIPLSPIYLCHQYSFVINIFEQKLDTLPSCGYDMKLGSIFWYECLYYHSNVPFRIPEFGYLCKWC